MHVIIIYHRQTTENKLMEKQRGLMRERLQIHISSIFIFSFSNGTDVLKFTRIFQIPLPFPPLFSSNNQRKREWMKERKRKAKSKTYLPIPVPYYIITWKNENETYRFKKMKSLCNWLSSYFALQPNKIKSVSIVIDLLENNTFIKLISFVVIVKILFSLQIFFFWKLLVRYVEREYTYINLT